VNYSYTGNRIPCPIFGKVVRDSMNFFKLFKLHRKVPVQSNKSESDEAVETIQWIRHRVKIMTRFKTTEKVKKVANRLALQCSLIAKEGTRISSLIRIQLEETKRKVRVQSPAALQFIGPGDNRETPIKKGGRII
jgi:hypothetical protein